MRVPAAQRDVLGVTSLNLLKSHSLHENRRGLKAAICAVSIWETPLELVVVDMPVVRDYGAWRSV
jgi:hypothetical protein